MADRYCYACDRPSASEVCENCGRTTSAADSDAGGHALRRTADYQIGPIPEASSPKPRTRWSLVAGLAVVAAVALASLRLPSALEESEPVDVAERVTPAPTTTWVFEPPRRVAWVPPAGTWVGLVGSETGAERLTGSHLRSDPPPGSFDILPDGSYLVRDGAELVIVGEEGAWDIELGESRPGLVALAPSGRRLAFVDNLGSLRIWDLSRRNLLTEVALPSPVQELMWSPDSNLVGLAFGRGYGVWDVRSGVLTAVGSSGSLVAVSQDGIAVWAEDRLELRELDGGLLRSWEELGPSTRVTGAFDPTGRFLALPALERIEESVEGEIEPPPPGLWMVSIFGTEQVRLGEEGPFAWSGNGEALFRLVDSALESRPVVVAFGPGPVPGAEPVVGEVGADDRLRTYDSALVPSGTLLLGAAQVLQPAMEQIAGASLIGPLPPHRPDDPQVLALAEPLIVFDDVDDPGVPVLVLEQENQRVTQMSEGWIFVDRADIAPYLFPGESVTSLAGHTLFVDQGVVQMVTRPSHEVVLHPRDLSADQILAVAGIRQTMFVLTETGGRGALYHVPVWSDVLRTSLTNVEGPSTPPLVVLTLDPPFEKGRITAAPDDATIAVEASSADGVTRTSLVWVGEGRPPCWPAFNSVCLLGQVRGTPVDFSPDGTWLLVRDPQGQALLVSARGRGTFALDLGIPTRAAWTTP